MANTIKETARSRLVKVADILTFNKTATNLPWDPDSTNFPARRELPEIVGAPPGA